MKRAWSSKWVDKGDAILRSLDKQFTIIQGSTHWTLLRWGSAIGRYQTQEKAILAATEIWDREAA